MKIAYYEPVMLKMVCYDTDVEIRRHLQAVILLSRMLLPFYHGRHKDEFKERTRRFNFL